MSQESVSKNTDDVTSPYNMFKYSSRSELTRKYCERRIRKFFDYSSFLRGSNIEKRCNVFAQMGKKDTNWAISHIIRFLQYEKERVEKNEITVATLTNFVKPIKLYCEMCDIPIHWKKIVTTAQKTFLENMKN